MGRGEQRSPSPELAKLRDAVSRWREAGGGRGTRIPEALWNEAVRLARVDGVWRTAQVLRFKYESLKRRVDLDSSGDRESAAARSAREIDPTVPTARADEQDERRRSRRARTRTSPGRRATTTSRSTTRVARPRPSSEFVELPLLVGASRSASSSTSTGTVIEVEDPAGTRLVVRLSKKTRVDVARLISAFRGHGGRGA